jgi:acyl-CoA reductase-like NAD-dependent aldehyde dehydrogenase
MTWQSINPATEEVLATFEEHSPEQVNQILEEAQMTFSRRATTFQQRSNLMHRLADALRTGRAELARIATLEMGKPIAEAEVDKCAWNCDFYAEYAQQFLQAESVESSASQSYVAFEPLGVILAIMPWNFPYWQVFRFAAPAIMAGNTAILKHAPMFPSVRWPLSGSSRTLASHPAPCVPCFSPTRRPSSSLVTTECGL